MEKLQIILSKRYQGLSHHCVFVCVCEWCPHAPLEELSLAYVYSFGPLAQIGPAPPPIWTVTLKQRPCSSQLIGDDGSCPVFSFLTKLPSETANCWPERVMHLAKEVVPFACVMCLFVKIVCMTNIQGIDFQGFDASWLYVWCVCVWLFRDQQRNHITVLLFQRKDLPWPDLGESQNIYIVAVMPVFPVQ